MTKPTIQDLEFLARHIVLPFYQVKRLTPVRSEESRRENDAEHSWSVALFACALAPHIDPDLDIGKISQLPRNLLLANPHFFHDPKN